MARRVVRREVRKRGFFGWFFLILFLLFNALMAAWLISYFSLMSNMPAAGSAEQTGKIIGGGIATGFLVICWGAGAMILGLFALLTRGSKTINRGIRLRHGFRAVLGLSSTGGCA